MEKDLKKAVELHTAAANQGHSNAHGDGTNSLAICCVKGTAVEKNCEKAAEWLTAANQGHSNAQNILAFCYEKGQGVEKNSKKAVELYTAAAN